MKKKKEVSFRSKQLYLSGALELYLDTVYVDKTFNIAFVLQTIAQNVFHFENLFKDNEDGGFKLENVVK